MTFIGGIEEEWTFGKGEHPLEQEIRVSLSSVAAWRMYRETGAQPALVLSMFPRPKHGSRTFSNACDMLAAISNAPAHANHVAFARMVDERMVEIATSLGDFFPIRELNMTQPVAAFFDGEANLDRLNALVTFMMHATRYGEPVLVLEPHAAFWFELCDAAIGWGKHD